MSFHDIKDQDIPIRLLQNMLRQNRIPNGLLFWGPGGVGKRLTAMQLAKAVNCPAGDADACDVCLACRKVTHGNHPDVKVVAPVSKSRVIKVDTIESINEFASLRAFESTWRVFILLDAERMNLTAQNHFLKTLEEPPGNSLFVLVTEFPRVLLPTIRSRCQQLRFGALRFQTVAGLLIEQRGLSRERAEAIAALSQGQMSRALDLVDSEKREVVLDLTRRLADGEDPLALAEAFSKHLADSRERIAAEAKAGTQALNLEGATPEDKERMKAEEQAQVDAQCRRDMMEYLYLFHTWYRDVKVYELLGDVPQVLNRDQIDRLRDAAPIILEKKVNAIEKARLYLERNLKEERVLRDLFFALAS